MPNPEQLGSFVEWYQRCITGDEKGQAQIFLDRLFQGFGVSGSRLTEKTKEVREEIYRQLVDEFPYFE